MSFLKSLFGESSDVSMMRVLALLSLLIGGYLAIIGKNDCVVVFVVSAFSGKAAQKLLEKK